MPGARRAGVCGQGTLGAIVFMGQSGNMVTGVKPLGISMEQSLFRWEKSILSVLQVKWGDSGTRGLG